MMASKKAQRLLHFEPVYEPANERRLTAKTIVKALSNGHYYISVIGILVIRQELTNIISQRVLQTKIAR